MSRQIDLTGQRFGKLVAVRRMEPRPDGITRWLCRCDCGREHIVRYANLKNGHTTSCGCGKSPDLTGQVFGRLTVLGRSEQKLVKGGREYPLWECRCECGEIVLRPSTSLTNEKERMCKTCQQNENARLMRENAGFVGGTQTTKLREMTPSAANTSGTRGVYWHKKQKKWYACLKFQGKLRHLGSFDSHDEAARARRQAEEEYYQAFLTLMNLSTGK